MNIRENFADTLLRFEYDKECCTDLLSVLDAMLSNDEVARMMQMRVEEYRDGRLDWKGTTQDAERAAEILGIHKFQTRIVFYMNYVPYSLSRFLEKGLTEVEWYDSMIDLKWKARETKATYGIWGAHPTWFGEFFTAERVAFGRLQFNPLRLGARDVGYDKDGVHIGEGDTVIAIHIPSDDRTPFNKENREAAYRRARAYFEKLYGRRIAFRCGTWLLHPAHREILPENSNIRSFLDDFELIEGSFVPGNGNLWRIFNIPEYDGNPDSLPESTSLMRTYKSFIKRGGVPGTMVGYII